MNTQRHLIIMSLVSAMILLGACAKDDSAPFVPAATTASGAAPAKPTFIMIHLEAGYKACTEPYNLPDGLTADVCTTGWQAFFWPTLIELVEKADEYGFKLTLAFTPQWGKFITDDDTRLEQVRQWENRGHEIGFHHHPFLHPDWDGYSNTYSAETDSVNNPPYLGLVNVGFSQVAALPAFDDIISSTIGSLPDEYPPLMDSPRVVFGTGNQYDSYPDEIRPVRSLKPTLTHTPDRVYVDLTTRQLSTGMLIPLEEALPELERQYSNMNSDEVFGIVWHEFDYYQAKDFYIQWFGFIKQNGNSVKTMSEIAGDYLKTRQPRARVYATLVSHNERSPHTECDPVTTVQAGYLANRALTLQFAQMVRDRGAAWDMQSDYQYLDAVRNWDTDAEKAKTGGKNLIQYLAELAPDRIVLDAHGHTETGPNYADISYMHELMGAPRNGVLGGFIYYPVQAAVWPEFESMVTGSVYSNATWTVDILWGAATYQHQGPDSKASGIWRPKDAANFHVDDPNRRLVNVGGYTGTVAGLTDLLGKLHAGQLQPGHMYTATLFVNQCTLTAGSIQGLASEIDAHADDAAAGNLVWVTLPEAVRIWREEYSGVPTILQPDSRQNACGTCSPGTVCCNLANAFCYGTCVQDCRLPGNTCPNQQMTCDQTSGLCR